MKQNICSPHPSPSPTTFDLIFILNMIAVFLKGGCKISFEEKINTKSPARIKAPVNLN